MVGTPLYMAPEQATFNALDVDTRADIYALGVILYELLDRQHADPAGDAQAGGPRRDAAGDPRGRAADAEQPASAPRRRCRASPPSRQTEPARLGRFVRGDLDWIVMKALAKERQRRYESAIGLAQDIERFLDHEPVSAGPPTAGYRLRKFVRRNRPQVVAAALVLLALVGGHRGDDAGADRGEAAGADRRRRVGRGEASRPTAKRRGRRAAAAGREAAHARSRRPTRSSARSSRTSTRGRRRRTASRSRRCCGERLDQATAQIEGEAIGDPLAVARMQHDPRRVASCGLGYPEKAIALFTKARATLPPGSAPTTPTRSPA